MNWQLWFCVRVMREREREEGRDRRGGKGDKEEGEKKGEFVV